MRERIDAGIRRPEPGHPCIVHRAGEPNLGGTITSVSLTERTFRFTTDDGAMVDCRALWSDKYHHYRLAAVEGHVEPL